MRQVEENFIDYNKEIPEVSNDTTYFGYDTIVANDNQVYAKFDDNYFYPKYIVYYKDN